MRLSSEEVSAIREEIQRFDPSADTYLFGSRTDDAARGGDIDLLVVSDKVGFRSLLGMRRAILDRIGWQELDLIIRRHDEVDAPFPARVLKTGIKL